MQVTHFNEAIASNYRMGVLKGGAVNDTIYRNFNTSTPNGAGYDKTEKQLKALETGDHVSWQLERSIVGKAGSDEQMEAMREMREQTNSMMMIMAEKLG
jgi:hypothetical protein